MNNSLSNRLTQQFYEWEQRGRGWYKGETLVDLEPPFEPFFGHFVTRDIIDDGRKPSLFDRLFNIQHTREPKPPSEYIAAYEYEDSDEVVFFSILLPKQFKPNADRLDQFFTILSHRHSFMSLEIIANHLQIVFQCSIRLRDEAFLTTQFQAFFTECTIIKSGRDALQEIEETDSPLFIIDFGLQDEFLLPIKPYSNTENDPHTALYGVFNTLLDQEIAVVQVLFCGTQNAWAESIQIAACDATKKTSFFIDVPEMPQLAKEKTTGPLFGVTVRALTTSSNSKRAFQLLEHIIVAISHGTQHANVLIPLNDELYTVKDRIDDLLMRQTHRVGMLLNSRELSTLIHFPPIQLSQKLIGHRGASKFAPKQLIDQPYCLGMNVHQGISHNVGIDKEQRSRHIHMIGVTGSGKSTLLKSLIMQDVIAGSGCCIIDPHGDLIDSLLNAIPKDRITDVVLIDPTDAQFPVGLNILLAHSDLEKELLASDLVALFRRLSTSWGDQMNSVFANAISAFVYNTTVGTLNDLRKFLIDGVFQKAILATCTDAEIVYYWQKEYPLLKSSSIGPILTRLDSFLRPRLIRNMVSQKRGLNFSELMDTNKIILVKLSQGLIGEENSYLLGAVIVSKLQQIAMSRQSQNAESRVPFYLYIDEFHHFITPSMATILTGTRKYGLNLILSHQNIQQVSTQDQNIASSVLSGPGTRICFNVGDADAKRLQEGFSFFTAEDLQNLSVGEAVVRVNTAQQDFNVSVRPITSDNESNRLQIIEKSRSKYSFAVPIATDISPTPKEQPPVVKPTVSVAPISVVEEQKKVELREHRQIQYVIKKRAEEFGYIARLEVPTPNGNGQVDVLLEKDGKQIAIEISVATTAAWELHNIQKCLNAGYERIVVCTNSPSKRQQIQELIRRQLTKIEQAIISVITPDDIAEVFSITPPKDTVSVVKGYRVKLSYEPDVSRQHLLQNLFNKTFNK